MAPGKPFADRVVKVACPGGPRGVVPTRVLERYGRAWSSRSGARVEVVTYEAAAGPPSGPPADVWLLPPAEMPRWAAAGLLRPVPDAVLRDPAYAWDGVLPLYRSLVLKWDDRVYALPILGQTQLCFYRQDLFRDAREQAGYTRFLESKHLPPRQLTAPRTWEDFADIAEYFHNKPRPGVNHPCPSLPSSPEDDDGADCAFYSVAAPFARRAIPEDEQPLPADAERFPFHYDWDGRNPRINAAGFVHALALLRRLQACRPAGTAREPEKAFHDGEAVFCLATPAALARFGDATSRVRGKFGFCRVPGSERFFPYPATQSRPAPRTGNLVPYLGTGGWLAVVPRSAGQPEAAFDLLADLSGPKTSIQVVLEPAWGGSGFRRDHFDDRRGWNAFDLSQDDTLHLREVLKSTMNPALLNPVVRLRIPDEREHARAVVQAVRLAVSGQVPAQEALDEAARAWEQLDAKKSPEQRRREYRLSLGLRPEP